MCVYKYRGTGTYHLYIGTSPHTSSCTLKICDMRNFIFKHREIRRPSPLHCCRQALPQELVSPGDFDNNHFKTARSTACLQSRIPSALFGAQWLSWTWLQPPPAVASHGPGLPDGSLCAIW